MSLISLQFVKAPVKPTSDSNVVTSTPSLNVIGKNLGMIFSNGDFIFNGNYSMVLFLTAQTLGILLPHFGGQQVVVVLPCKLIHSLVLEIRPPFLLV